MSPLDAVAQPTVRELQNRLEDRIFQLKQLADCLSLAASEHGASPSWVHLIDQHAGDIREAFYAWAEASHAEGVSRG